MNGIPDSAPSWWKVPAAARPKDGQSVDYIADGHHVQRCTECGTTYAEVIEQLLNSSTGARLIVREWHMPDCRTENFTVGGPALKPRPAPDDGTFPL